MTSLICNVINRRPEIDNLSTLSHLLTHLHNDLSRNMSRHRMLHQLERQLGIRL
jgi:ubiquitin C-terminal hydrolase